MPSNVVCVGVVCGLYGNSVAVVSFIEVLSIRFCLVVCVVGAFVWVSVFVGFCWLGLWRSGSLVCCLLGVVALEVCGW